MNRLKLYYRLTKPGIIRGNAIHVLAGALLASMFTLQWQPIVAVLIGTSLVIASACVANNYMDRGIDARMKRTRERASVTGEIPLLKAMVFSAVLLMVGLLLLGAFTNLTVIIIGLIAYVLYVFAYGWAKRHTVHSTLVGAVPGALPAMAGYVAVNGSLSLGAWLIFLLVLAWQMPHFYAISLFRKDEYESAGVPVLGVVTSFVVVKRYILAYMLIYVMIIAAMIYLEVVGPPAGLLLLTGAAYWIYVYWTAKGDEKKWARSVFGASLILTLLLLVSTGLNMFTGPAV